MNKLNIASTGYPGTTESWKFLNKLIQELAEAVAGQVTDTSTTSTPVIIYGIRQNQIGYTDGFFVYKGELFRFIGGQPQDYVCIIEDVENATYNTDMANSGQLADLPTYYKRYARFGGNNEGIDRFLFADMKRMKDLFTISEKVNPAAENNAGIISIATQAEVDAGVDDSKVVTSLKLQQKITNSSPIVQTGQIDTGIWSDTDRIKTFSVQLANPTNSYIVNGSLIYDDFLPVNNNDVYWWYIKNKTQSGFDVVIRRKDDGGSSSGDPHFYFDYVVIK